MPHHVIYDGNCNLCTNFVQLLEQVDRGDRFDYIPMQDRETLAQFDISEADCAFGMMLIDADHPDQRWQGSAAAEEIARQLPLATGLVEFYRRLPGLKDLGDRAYDQIRDNRYAWFGRREQTYRSAYPCNCPPTTTAAEV
ncbi:MAG: DUF393 domain-containing protein [Spirulinaceae cyanobacterium RM2_2_10]|nr:DUF393 domain-containing protein [Spirulinaceae cyanobacterium SM2_1_0]NJO21113.1 DUF393 domain-containing protein [Spirulinaceae cyanobacterium RM2_2_10]